MFKNPSLEIPIFERYKISLIDNLPTVVIIQIPFLETPFFINYQISLTLIFVVDNSSTVAVLHFVIVGV